MEKTDIRESVEKILRDTFPDASLSLAFDAIEGMDSLDYLCFTSDVEARFDTKIPREKVANFVNCLELCDWLETR